MKLGEIRQRRKRADRIRPARLLLEQRGVQALRLCDIAVLECILDRQLLHVHVGQPVALADRGPLGCRSVRRAVTERARQEATQLEQRAVTLFDAQVDDPFPRLALTGDDEYRSAAAPAPVTAGRLRSLERAHQPLGERAARACERLAH